MTSEHYFSAEPQSESTPRTIAATIAGRSVQLTTDTGVFSSEHVDTGTQLLLATAAEPPESGNLLDLGCGWGPIALTLGLKAPGADVWAVDVNERALRLTRHNANALGLHNVRTSLPSDLPADIRFATIWSNPPIRVGKTQLHALLRFWSARLEVGADMWLVVAKHLGAESLQRWLAEELQLDVSRVEQSKGFRVLRAVNS